MTVQSVNEWINDKWISNWMIDEEYVSDWMHEALKKIVLCESEPDWIV